MATGELGGGFKKGETRLCGPCSHTPGGWKNSGDSAVESRVARLIHFAHAADADGGEDFIGAELIARRKRHLGIHPSVYEEVAKYCMLWHDCNVDGVPASVFPQSLMLTSIPQLDGKWASRTMAQSLSRSLRPTNLPLLSRRLQLPVPLGVDLLLMPGEHVLRRDVANRAVPRTLL